MLMGSLYPYYQFLRDFGQYIWHEKYRRKCFISLRQLFGRTSFSSSFINFCSTLMKLRLLSANLGRELLYTDRLLWGRKLVKVAKFLTIPNPWSICKDLFALLSLPVSTRLLLSSSFVMALPRQAWSLVPQVSFHPEKWNSYMLEH